MASVNNMKIASAYSYRRLLSIDVPVIR